MVEGPYDKLTMENLFDSLFSAWRGAGIVIVPVGSKKGVLRPFQFLQNMDVDVHVCLDADALERVDAKWRDAPFHAPISPALDQAARAGKLSPDELTSVLTAGDKIGHDAHYPERFVKKWRQQLSDRSWYVLTSELDGLVLRAAGMSTKRGRGSTNNKRKAEELSRTMPADKIPEEIVNIVDKLKVR